MDVPELEVLEELVVPGLGLLSVLDTPEFEVLELLAPLELRLQPEALDLLGLLDLLELLL